ncbi:hypothetical protein CLD22_28730 [Rubrivivax gelatinosus]|nr:DUF4398 domain-containing protein [Rubrivivax gelatinosus]MBZ8143783.1 hypothetical protein [Rubrivivax gelatinosus]
MNTRTNHPTRRLLLPALVVAALALGACATTPPPAELGLANAALSHAVAAGAPEFAPVEMAAAREKMTRANKAMADQEPERARALAQQAQLDAQLAEARAESEKARRADGAMRAADGALREEMARQPK